MNVLEIENLEKSLGKNLILKNISLCIKEKEIVGIVGKNGAGKTTMLKCMVGLYHYRYGSIKLCGYDVETDIENALFSVGCIIEKPDFYENLSGRKNLKICEILTKNKKLDDIDELIKSVHLESAINRKVKTYSLGMKQRLAIAQALLHHPKFLILDEPLNGLDPTGIIEVRDIIRKLNQKGITILISSHLLDELQSVCTRIIFIDEGRIIGDVRTKDLDDEGIKLEDRYMQMIKEVKEEC